VAARAAVAAVRNLRGRQPVAAISIRWILPSITMMQNKEDRGGYGIPYLTLGIMHGLGIIIVTNPAIGQARALSGYNN
jgi:hypothetical protein